MKERIFALISLLLVVPCQGRIITVDDDGPADFATIWSAVEDANSGDTVLVADGTYQESIVIESKSSITVRSKNGPSNCIIDCQGPNPIPGQQYFGFLINTDAPDCVIDGFTITRASTTYSSLAGGITCDEGTVIRNCIFEESYSQYLGAAVGVNRNCGSEGPEVINCTFVNNLSTAVVIKGGSYDKITLRNCISWANPTPDLSSQASGKCGVPMIHADFSILQADWYNFATLANCIVADPCFADPCNGDFHLKSQAGRWDPVSHSWVNDNVSSVGIDAGDPNSDWTKELWPNGKRINMGAYGGTPEASMSLSTAGNIANLDKDPCDFIDFNDLNIFAEKWCFEEHLLAEDLDRNGNVDFNDFAIFGEQYFLTHPIGEPCEPGITSTISPCDQGMSKTGSYELMDSTRFTVTVNGHYIHFEDMMVGNCCTPLANLWVEMTINNTLVTIYEHEQLPQFPCTCICDYPVDADAEPFESGSYTLDVYQIQDPNLGSSFIGSTTFTIN